MQDLLEQAIAAYECGEACVLCTVVRLDGSGYGRPGARLFLSESGDRIGFISGGCLEKDLCRRVWDATAAGPKLIAFDTSGNSVDVPRYNTGCEGVVYVFCQRINERHAGVMRRVINAIRSGREIRLLTVYRSDSDYAQVGDTLLIDIDGNYQQINIKGLLVPGLCLGTHCSGGSASLSNASETCVLDDSAGRAFKSIGSKVEPWNQSVAIAENCQNSQSNQDYPSPVTPALFAKLQSASRNGTFALHDSNGDVIEAAIEIILPPRRLVIFGSGDDVIPVSTASVALDWRVTVVGHRVELTQRQRFPGAEVLCGPMHEIAEELLVCGTHFSDNADIVIMTHDFDRDVELMGVLLDSPVRSIGLLGPKRRLGQLLTRLHHRGRKISDRDIDRIRSPLGLDIGANSPAEIATSIVAELIALSRERQGGFLHQRRQPIHQSNEHERLSTVR